MTCASAQRVGRRQVGVLLCASLTDSVHPSCPLFIGRGPCFPVNCSFLSWLVVFLGGLLMLFLSIFFKEFFVHFCHTWFT